MKKIIHLLLLLIVLVAHAQESQGKEVSTSYGSYINVNSSQLADLLASDEQFLFINTHIPYEGEIEGTDSFIAFNEIEQFFPVLPKDKDSKIVVYCRSGGMSKTASETLVKLGYTNVVNLERGMIDWQRQGYTLKDSFAELDSTEGQVNMELLSTMLAVPRYRFIKTTVEGDALLGSLDNDLYLVEFSDFNCPYCAKFHTETLPEITRDYGNVLNYVYRDYISVGGNVSTQAAMGTECTRDFVDDTAYLGIVNRLYAVEGRKTVDKLLEITADYSIDPEALRSCIDSDKYREEVLTDLQDGQAVGIRGTPGFVLGYMGQDGLVEGISFSGALPYQNFASLINSFLEAKQ